MHEMSLCQSILDSVIQASQDQCFQQVKAIRLAIGKLVSVEKQLFQFSFDILSKNTLAEKARLEFIEIEGQGYCPVCGKQVPMNSLYCVCPLCKNWGLEVVQGKELKILDLEVI